MDKAFYVKGELDPSLGTPMDAISFLKTVRYEARRLPDVNVSNIDPRKYDQNRTIVFDNSEGKCKIAPDEYLPRESWKIQYIKYFTNLRERMEKRRLQNKKRITDLPSIKDQVAWKNLCFEKYKIPSLKLFMSLDESSIARLTRYHIEWLTEEDQFTENRLQWIFSLFMFLDTPIDDDTSASLRSLLLKLCEKRASLKSVEDELLGPINILITIMCGCFDQVEY